LYKIPANTLFMGQQFAFVPQCHSTNNEVQRLIQQKGALDGVVVITDHQTRGRGQHGSSWESEAGKNLTFSIGLQPRFLEAKEHFYLSASISLGLYDLMVASLPDYSVKIKWPNDIMVDDQKICGILIENTIIGSTIQHAIVGIGLNVNQRSFSISKATSMALCIGKEFSLDRIFEQLLEYLEARYLQLRAGEYTLIKHQYEQALYWRNEEHHFSGSSGDVFPGTIIGLDPDGRLLINSNNGLKIFGFKEIAFLR
jgi:BirA family transcriptional regulator, biotin operon repressor / biotin---[acetyl-CoA-carboxylase] ligase